MNLTRIIILAVAALAAVIAAIFVRGAMQPGAEPEAAAPQPETATVQVLAFRQAMQPGKRVAAGDLYWRAWPEEALVAGYFTENSDADADERFAGAVVRASVGEGEPVTANKLVVAGEAGFMAAVLTPGMRAVAVPISAESGAGGFILPNDRVDVISTIPTDDGFRSDVVVENVRVLAIDQTYSEDGDGAKVGSTATLEVRPDQARLVAHAVAEGDVALALRSVADRQGGPMSAEYGVESDAPAPQSAGREQSRVRVFRYGEETQVAVGGRQ